ncbi:MAG TPA: 4-(cytidine 5'-diphospho)-2-C-methyl-D-erythritol kinase [Thermomicrobiales bacterium]|nr:4-(cytidine 5'-diphospho)-2-C-methyl-D-erythritol kinase [Thermomicrobiales bacterium]
MTARFTIHAPAKLNLGLEVTGRRADGYHELVTIFQALTLHDTLAVAPAARLTLTVEKPGDPAGVGVPAGAGNLVLWAARALQAWAGGPPRGAALTLTKRVPVAAGLGGGSSDAAATLVALDRLWGLGVPEEELAALAAGLGADVPFFLRGGTALATGIGERLAPLPPLATAGPRWFVTLTPPLALPPAKTRRLYAALRPADFGDGARTRAQAARLRAGLPLDPALLVNAFAGPLERLFPELADWRARFLATGAPWVLPSGSGPTLFTAVDSAAAGRRLAARLAGAGARVHVAAPLDPGPA